MDYSISLIILIIAITFNAGAWIYSFRLIASLLYEIRKIAACESVLKSNGVDAEDIMEEALSIAEERNNFARDLIRLMNKTKKYQDG